MADAAVSEREQKVLEIIETARAKRPRFKDETVTMAHGAGGKATQTLIEGLLVPALAAKARPSRSMGDAGVVTIDDLGLALTTDSYVVRPIRFPGGSIGELAVNGTANDLAVAGAQPKALSLSLILEEGLPADELRAEVEAIAAAAEAADVEIVTGDTKVVERGHADGMYICTAGIGKVDPRAPALPAGADGPATASSSRARSAITARRSCSRADEFSLDAEILSDTRPLWPAVDALLDAAGAELHCMRDATRGGVASVLNELARASGVAISVREADVPVNPAVAGAAEMLGIDPMYVANEGKLVAFVAPGAGGSGARRAALGARAARTRRRSERSRRSRRAWCSWRPHSAASGSWTSWSATRCRGSADDLSEPSPGGEMANAVEFVPDQAKTEAVEAHVIWMTTGLGCDGDSVAMTSAVDPSLEDIVTQAIPGMPKVIVHNPVLAYENGDEFMQAWYDAEAGKLDPFVLIVEGSIPNEELSGEGYWAAMGNDPDSGQPITTNEWVDRLAPKAAAVVALGTCATYGGIPAMKNNPTGAMGLADYLGWDWKSSAGLPVVNIPGCPVQPDNTTESLLYLALHLAGRAPVPDLDEAHRPTWLFGRTVRESCNRGGFSEQGEFATEYGSDHRCLVKLGCKGPVRQVQRPGPRLAERRRRLPQRRRDLHGVHDARLPRQVHAVHGRGPAGAAWPRASRSSPRSDRAQLPAAEHPQEVRRASPSGAGREVR